MGIPSNENNSHIATQPHSHVGDSVLLVVIQSLEKFRFAPGHCVRLAVGLFLALFGSCSRLQIDIKFDSKMESDPVRQGGRETFSLPCPFAISKGAVL